MIEKVYNAHMILNRKRKGQPFRVKKDFKDFENHKDYRHYLALANFFNKKPEIDVDTFFEATSYFLSDVDYIPIAEFAKSKALTNYVEYIKILDALDLDDKKNLEWCISTFKFINKFLKANNLKRREYLDFKSTSGSSDFLVHIKRNNVCKYALFVFPSFRNKLDELYRDSELWEFYLGKSEFSSTFLWQRWNKCVKFKTVSEALYNKL